VQANSTETCNERTCLQRDWFALLTAGLTKGRVALAFVGHSSRGHHLVRKKSVSPAFSLVVAY
jgi:hypothetical protein